MYQNNIIIAYNQFKHYIQRFNSLLLCNENNNININGLIKNGSINKSNKNQYKSMFKSQQGYDCPNG